MKARFPRTFATLLAAAWLPATAVAGSNSSTFDVSMQIVPDCIVSAAGIDFGQAQGVLAAVVSGSGSVSVTCTNTTPYNIGLDGGTGLDSSDTVRYMYSAATASKLRYDLFHDNASARWGNMPGTNTVGGVGDGRLQTLRVRGEVPVQNTPAPGTYTSTVTATVYF